MRVGRVSRAFAYNYYANNDDRHNERRFNGYMVAGLRPPVQAHCIHRIEFSNKIGPTHMKRLILASLIAMPTASAFACATCGCSLSTDAATGYTAAGGWYMNLEYDYLNQNQLRSGTHAVSPASVAAINDHGGDQEVEHGTINRYATLSLTYAANADWNVKLSLPYLDRSHTTYGSAGNPLAPDQLSGAQLNGLGDIKLVASYQGLLPTHNLGLQLGIKLPSGRYGGANADGSGIAGLKPTAFTSGPLAQNATPDNLLDTSLQLGTGRTDLIAGANADGSGIAGLKPTAFTSGPLAQNATPDNLLDTSLQLGTGRTDLIAG